MRKTKVMTIVGTRPEIIRLSAVIKACDKYFDHILVHTGQNWDYTLNEIFFKELEIRKPDYFLNVPGKHLGETIGNIISASYEVLQKEMPDALLILGDTNSALSAIPAKRLKIPIFHMEAGNRCFDQNVPEEINRKIVDHISDINLPYTEHSRRYLLSEGFKKEHIYVTGSPMPEVLFNYKDKIDASDILERLGLQKRKYIIIYSTHPRSWKKIEERGVKFNPLIRRLKPFGFFDYNKLQQNAFCVLSDSGTLSEESAILGFPAVLFRTSTERPEVLDKGSIVIGGIKANDVVNAIRIAVESFKNGERAPIPKDYEDRNVSLKVVKIIESYIKIINRVTWYKGV